MGIYYQVYNNTKRETVHLDKHIKRGPMLNNEAVHYAIMVYLFENQGDNIQLLPDSGGAISFDQEDYLDVDLLKYPYKTEGAISEIVAKLNSAYGEERYQVIGGVGEEI